MTALGSVNAGSRITASMLRSVAPLAAYKATTQSVTSSTTLVNDSALFVTVLASAVYDFSCVINYTGGTQGSSDLKYAWSVPSGAVMTYQLDSISIGGSWTAAYSRGAAGGSAGTGGTGVSYTVKMTGSIAVSTTAGNVQFQWAQNTSNATATQVEAGSILSLWQVQ